MIEKTRALGKVIMWQDIMLGIADKDLGDFDFEPHYTRLADCFGLCKENSVHFGNLFDFYQKLSLVLAIKSGIGRSLCKAYKDNYIEYLKTAVDVILPDLHTKIKELHNAHRELFMSHHKSVGWEILDIRYGGAIQRVDTALYRIKQYVSGQIKSLEELEQQRLSFDNTNMIPGNISYGRICSASRISEKV